jgi:tRNA-specific 2-thiouridylase
MEMAEEFGLDDYPSPASGCLLTDSSYSGRLRDLLSHSEHITFDDLNLLRAGRHFRLNPHTKLIVGRTESDNRTIASCAKPEHIRLEAVKIGSPLTLLIGDSSEEAIEKAAALTARYSAARKEPQVDVTVTSSQGQHLVKVRPATAEEIEAAPLGK